jgi:hypothetical protein
MTTYEAFAQRPAERAQRPLFFTEVEKLAREQGLRPIGSPRWD